VEDAGSSEPSQEGSDARKGLAVAVVAAAVVVPLAAAAPSSGAQSTSTQVRPMANSHYLAGYRLTDPDHVSVVLVKAVTVPTIRCPRARFHGVAFGAGSEPVVGQSEFFGGVNVACLGRDQPSCALDAVVGDTEQQNLAVAAGDQVQITISVDCSAFPTCHVFSDATKLANDETADAEADVTLSGDSAEFGAFPMFSAGSKRFAPVPAFETVRVDGCLFDLHLITQAASQRLARTRMGNTVIHHTRIDNGSFRLRYVGH
jgi:hypothetical protein